MSARGRIPEPGIWGVVAAKGHDRLDSNGKSDATWVRVCEDIWRRTDNGLGVLWSDLDSPRLIRQGVES